MKSKSEKSSWCLPSRRWLRVRVVGMSEVISPKVAEWHDRIVFAATKGIECILGTCKLVVAADKDLGGDFKQLVEMLPWSKGWTSLLRRVGREQKLFVMTNKLPSDVRTLYHLARLSDERSDLSRFDWYDRLREIREPTSR